MVRRRSRPLENASDHPPMPNTSEDLADAPADGGLQEPTGDQRPRKSPVKKQGGPTPTALKPAKRATPALWLLHGHDDLVSRNSSNMQKHRLEVPPRKLEELHACQGQILFIREETPVPDFSMLKLLDPGKSDSTGWISLPMRGDGVYAAGLTTCGRRTTDKIRTILISTFCGTTAQR